MIQRIQRLRFEVDMLHIISLNRIWLIGIHVSGLVQYQIQNKSNLWSECYWGGIRFSASIISVTIKHFCPKKNCKCKKQSFCVYSEFGWFGSIPPKICDRHRYLDVLKAWVVSRPYLVARRQSQRSPNSFSMVNKAPSQNGNWLTKLTESKPTPKTSSYVLMLEMLTLVFRNRPSRFPGERVYTVTISLLLFFWWNSSWNPQTNTLNMSHYVLYINLVVQYFSSFGYNNK